MCIYSLIPQFPFLFPLVYHSLYHLKKFVTQQSCGELYPERLNETARSYKTLALEIDTIDGLEFVWFTDGKGWTSARHNLEETFDVMEHVYNIKDLENDIINKKLR